MFILIILLRKIVFISISIISSSSNWKNIEKVLIRMNEWMDEWMDR